LAAGLPGPAGEVYSTPPDTLSGLGEPTSKGRKWEREEVGKGVEGGNGREWRERGEKRRGVRVESPFYES